MVKLNKIYTRTGDDGTTGLGTGERRKKYDLRIAAYGTIDEANAAIGVARLHTAETPRSMPRCRVSRTICSTSAPICARPARAKGPGGARLTVTQAQVAWLEKEIDRLNAELAPLKSFVLPGGSAAAAYLHLARTHLPARRAADRRTQGQARRERDAEVLKYVNRLSDYLFVASRYANGKGARDVLWKPGDNR